ncbi:MAG TPA: hypothetical protein VE907_20900, partial [Gammaproteobacteria bacterium]|nr:hypothetical protein [Gammaproteobacteria bacterium]
TSLYLEPDGDTSRYTLNLSIDDASISKLPEKHGATRSDPSAGGKEYSGGRSFGDELADAFWQGLKQAVVDAAQRASDERRASAPDPGTLVSQESPPDSPAPPPGPPPGAIIVPPGTLPAAEEPELEPPQIFGPGTLTATLVGQAAVRRVGGRGRWFGADGKPIDNHFYLDGKITSEFFDAPTQHPPADELAAVTAKLAAAIASFPANKGGEVTSEGRVYYGFEAGAAGVRHYTADLVMLDVEYVSNVEGTEGYTGLVITCRTFDPCAIGWSEDAEGHASDVTTTGAFRIYVATEQDRDALRGALAELKRLYPAEPKVTAN